MKAVKILLTLGLIFLVMGCTNDNNATDNNTSENNQNVKFNTISTNNLIDQTASNQAKKSISKHDDITVVNAANTDKKMIIAFEVKHHKRFQLSNINKKIQKKMDNEFPDLKVEISTDKKLVLDIDELEKKIDKQNISQKTLKKEVDHLIKLMKDKT